MIKMCEFVLNSGVVKNYEKVMSEGIEIEFYTVELDGEEYNLTKHNGEWVYFYHC